MNILVDRDALLQILHEAQDADTKCLGKFPDPMPHHRRIVRIAHDLLYPHNEKIPA